MSNKQNVSGEGNYEAARHYNEDLAKSVAKGQSHDLAEKAKKALQGKEGGALRSAEEKGKRAQTPGK